jgi:hypothetical protein
VCFLEIENRILGLKYMTSLLRKYTAIRGIEPTATKWKLSKVHPCTNSASNKKHTSEYFSK